MYIVRYLFGTEAIEEGKLAKELLRYGSVEKPHRLTDDKTDLIFEKEGFKMVIEITNMSSKKPNKRSDIKSYQILSRLYYNLKWNLKDGIPSILVINDIWGKANWLKKEIMFLKRFNSHILFTNFKDGWEKDIAIAINKLNANYLDSNTTRLAFDKSLIS